MNIQDMMNYLSTRPGAKDGEAVRLLVLLEGMKVPLKSVVADMEPEKRLRVHVPAMEFPEIEFTRGRKATVIYLRNGILHSFTSRIMDFSKEAPPALDLDYPESIDIHSRRKHKRVSTRFPASLEANGKSVAGIIANLSRGGCRFSSSDASPSGARDVKAGDEVTVTVSVFGKTIIEQIRCRVVYISEEARTLSMGMEFLDPSEEVSTQIDDYVNSVAGFEEKEVTLADTLHI